jgi:hypothetical protein
MPRLRAAAYAIALVWLNLYICRGFFNTPHTGSMWSMQGFWAGLARLGSFGTLAPQWWRFHDGGAPFEFTYSPVVPALASLFGVQAVSGIVYCLTPLAVYALAGVLTRSAGWGFTAGAAYSLTALSQLAVPDAGFASVHLIDARRLYLMGSWDETPHMLGLTFAVLAVAAVRLRWWVSAGVCMALSVASSAFGATILLLGLTPLLPSRRTVLAIAATGAAAYAVICPWLPTSLVLAIGRNAQLHSGEGHNWNPKSLLALGITSAAVLLLWWLLRRFRAAEPLRYAVLFAAIATSIPLLWERWGIYFIPQPGRYKVEAEFGLALLCVLGARALLMRGPKWVAAIVAVAAVSLGAESTIRHRRYAKALIRPADVTKTIEYRVARWADANREGRIFAPGTIGQWLNEWTDREQFSGGSYSTAYNPVQQVAFWGIYPLEAAAADTAILWWKAFGVGQAVITGKNSPEFWKPFAHPDLLEGKLTALWREDDTTIYRVPLKSPSYAHAVPAGALVTNPPRSVGDIAELRRYVDAIDAAPPAEFRWTGANSAVVTGDFGRGDALSVQVNWHPGWRATAEGRAVPLARDGLGFIWAAAPCDGPCAISLTYTGGAEAIACRVLSGTVLLALALYPILRRRGMASEPVRQ